MDFWRGFSVNFIGTAIVLAISFINNVVVTRCIGPTGRGQYVILTTTAMLFSLFFGEGIRRSNTYLLGKDKSRAKRLLGNSIFYGLGVGIVVFLIYIAGERLLRFLLVNVDDKLIGLTLAISVLLLIFENFQAILLGLERIVAYSFFPVLLIGLYFVFNLVTLFFLHWGLTGVIVSWFFAEVLIILVAFSTLWKWVGIRFSFDSSLFANTAKTGFRATVASVLILLLFRSDLYLVNYLLGAKQAGIYSIAILYAEMIQRIPNIAGVILFPKVSSDLTQKDRLTVSVSRQIISIVVLSSLVLIIFGRPMTILIFKKDFAGAYLPFLFMIPGIIIAAFGSILNVNLWGRGYPLVTMIAPATALLCNIILNIILIPRIGLIGAGLSTSIAYTVWAVIILNFFLKDSSLSLSDFFKPVAESLNGGQDRR